MTEFQAPDSERKTYYVAVGAKQILEDAHSASFEFAIPANEDELTELQDLFEEIQDSDEDNAFHFSGSPSVSDVPENATYNLLLKDIYRLLHKLGTNETRSHIESMNILR